MWKCPFPSQWREWWAPWICSPIKIMLIPPNLLTDAQAGSTRQEQRETTCASNHGSNCLWRVLLYKLCNKAFILIILLSYHHLRLLLFWYCTQIGQYLISGIPENSVWQGKLDVQSWLPLKMKLTMQWQQTTRKHTAACMDSEKTVAWPISWVSWGGLWEFK